MSAQDRPVASAPENLTHCIECGLPFPEPVENWDDYFQTIEDASFACEACAEREGYTVDTC